MKHLSLIVFIILWNSGVFAKTCLNHEEIEQAISEFQTDILDLVPQNMPLPTIVYRDLNLNMSGYTDFNDAKNITIHLLGHKCKDEVYKDEIKLILCHELACTMRAHKPFC